MAVNQSKRSPWVWVAAGCAGLVVVIMVVVAVGSFILVRKGQEFVQEMADNPAMALARAIDLANPEIEIVGQDEQARTVTFRQVKTGETMTVAWDKIEQGELSFTGPDGQVVFRGEGSAEQGQGSLTITSDEGTVRLDAGAGLDHVPAWVPIYPQATAAPTGAVTMAGATEAAGFVGLTTADAPETVVAHYQRELRAAGYEVTVTRMNEQERSVFANVAAVHRGEKRTVSVSVSSEQENTVIGLHYALED